jgi:hypothetical protein
MHLCTSAGTDAEGNHCNWVRCGLDQHGGDYFGGCSGNTTAGALCVPSACANGAAAQSFSGGMVGCAGSIPWPNAYDPSAGPLCATGYHPAMARDWVQFQTASPGHNYWTTNNLSYTGTSSNCAVAYISSEEQDPTAFHQCGNNSPMHVCTLSGTDVEGNSCTWANCGYDAVSTPNKYFGGCLSNTAGELCIHGYTSYCPQGCAADCANQSDSCPGNPWPNGTVYYEVVDGTVQLDSQGHTAAFSQQIATSLANAMQAWTTATGGRIKFVQNSSRADRLQLKCDHTDGNGNVLPNGLCDNLGGGSCHVGYTGALTSCTFGGGTGVNTIAHELGHGIGFYHQHKRGDRDRYVKVMPNNFTCGSNNWSDNWTKCGVNDSGSDFGVYDENSVMHYIGTAPFYIVDNATQLPVGTIASPQSTPSQGDGSAALEMYAYPLHWQKFVSLSTDKGERHPLDPAIPLSVATSTGTMLMGQPAITTQSGSGNLDAYFLASDQHIYHRYATGGAWQGYDDMGYAPWDTQPGATSFGTGSSLLVSTWKGGIYWIKYTAPSWGNWQGGVPVPPVSMKAGTSIAMGSYGPGVFHLFIHGSDDNIWSVSNLNDNWNSWQKIPGTISGETIVGTPAVSSQGPNAFDVFVTTCSGTCTASAPGSIWHTYYSSGWIGNWDRMVTNASVSDNPTASSWGPARVDLFYKGADGLLNWKSYDSGWNPSIALGGILSSSPAAVSSAKNRIDVLALGADRGLWRRTFQQ